MHHPYFVCDKTNVHVRIVQALKTQKMERKKSVEATRQNEENNNNIRHAERRRGRSEKKIKKSTQQMNVVLFVIAVRMFSIIAMIFTNMHMERSCLLPASHIELSTQNYVNLSYVFFHSRFSNN